MSRLLSMVSQRQPWLFLLLLPAWVYLGVVLPIVDGIVSQGMHINFFSYLTLALVPALLGTGVLAIGLRYFHLKPSDLDLWQMLALAPIMILCQWGVMMAVVTLSLFVLPAWINEGITGAFYYYMVPFDGIWLGALVMNTLAMASLYRQYGCPFTHATAWSSRARAIVCAILPLTAAIHFGIHYLLFEMIF